MPPKSFFPKSAITEARKLADTIAQKNAGEPMRRLEVFDELKRSPESSASRRLVTSSAHYGLTTGSYKAETLTLTPLGRRVAIDGDPAATIDAVLNVEVFKQFFEKYKDGLLPTEVPAKSFLAGVGIPPARTKDCLDVAVAAGRAAGLIAILSGTERVLSRDHAVENAAKGVTTPPLRRSKEERREAERDIGKPGGERRPALPSLNINLEIHLPADAKPETYDAIFTSLRKHLVDGE